MELRQLVYFHQICEDKCFSTAAKHLFISQQGLSMSIQRLEEELGCKLFIRSPHNIQLTSDGEYLLEKTLDILPKMEEIQTHFNELYHQPSKLTIGLDFKILGLVDLRLQKILLNQDPNFPVENSYGLGLQIEKKLDDKSCRIGFVCGPIDKNKYTAHHLFSMDYCYLINNEHPYANKSSLHLKDLANENIIIPDSDSKIYHEFKQLCENNGFTPNISIECNSQTAVSNIIKHNSALIGQVVEYYAKDLIASEIKALKLDDVDLHWNLYLIWRKDIQLTKQEKAFISLVQTIYP